MPAELKKKSYFSYSTKSDKENPEVDNTTQDNVIYLTLALDPSSDNLYHRPLTLQTYSVCVFFFVFYFFVFFFWGGHHFIALTSHMWWLATTSFANNPLAPIDRHKVHFGDRVLLVVGIVFCHDNPNPYGLPSHTPHPRWPSRCW